MRTTTPIIRGTILREGVEYVQSARRPWCLTITTPDGEAESYHASPAVAVAAAQKWAADRCIRLQLDVAL